MSVVDDAFVRESTTRARELSNALIAVERDPDDEEAIDEAFRVAHTLKGNCGAAGLNDASDLAHAVEDVLEAVRRGSLDPTGEVIDDALAAVDDVEDVVRAAGRGEATSVDADARIAALRDRLDESLGERGGEGSIGGDADAESEGQPEHEGGEAPPGIEFPEMPTEGQDISAEEALDRASVFDDIDQLVDEMDDDAEEFADLGNAGTFDQFSESEPEPGTAEPEPGGSAGVEAAAEPDPDPEPEPEPEPEAESGSLDQSGNVGDVFAEIKSEVDDDGDDVDTLQTEIEEVQFGEFDDDDDMTIQELIEGGSDEPTAEGVDPEPTVADAGADEPVADPDPGVAAGDEPALDEEPSLDLDDVVETVPEPEATEPRALGETEPAITEAPIEPRVLGEAEPAVTEAPVEPRALGEAEPAITEAPVEPRVLGEAEPAITEAPVEPRTLGEAEPAVTEAPVEPRVLGEAEPAVTEAPVEPRALADEAEPAVTATVTEAPPEPRVQGDAEPAVVAATPGPRAFVDDVDPAVTPAAGRAPRELADETEAAIVTAAPGPRALGEAEPAVVEASVEPDPDPRPLADEATAAITAAVASPEPRTLGEAEPAITAPPTAPRTVDDDLEPAVAASPVEPRALADEVDPAVTPAAAATSEPSASDAAAAIRELGEAGVDADGEVSVDATVDVESDAGDGIEAGADADADATAGVGAPADESIEAADEPIEADEEPSVETVGADDGGFEWADGFAAGDDVEADDGDEEPSVEDLVAGAEEAPEADAIDEVADEPADPELEADREPEPSLGSLDDDEAGEVPSIEDIVDVDEPALDEPTAPDAGPVEEDADLGGMDADADVDFDAEFGSDADAGVDSDVGVGADAGADAVGDLPDLPDLDLDGVGSATEPESGFDAFADEETAAFESRFSTAFEEAEEVAAVEAAAAAVNSATTIEESDVDAGVFGGDRPPEPASDPAERTADIQTLTVDVENADELLTLAETLTVSRLQIEGAIDPDNEAAVDALSELSTVASNFRRTVMDIRLMPLRTVVDTLPRVVRDVARREDKDVEFHTEGTDVRLDRSVIDRIGDPLIHLVRNAVDHGIEPPEVREANGKESTGHVELRAEQRRDSVVVEVSDDGGGIDADAVRAGAVEDDMLTFEEAESLSDEEVHELLFRPGFTTASEVTEVSGRGVGMDVVDRVLTELDGSVEIDSEPGEGTTVRLTLPVTVAMADVWLVESGGETFAVPARAVEQIEDPRGAEMVDGREMFTTPSLGLTDGGDRLGVGSDADAEPDAGDDEPIPLVRLREAFDTPGDRNERGMVMRMREGARPLALHVDRVIDQQEVVVKPYGELLGDVPGVTGATLRGDGQLVNVVDVDTVGDRA